MPSDIGELDSWSKLLRIDVILPTSRVSVIHFFDVDVMVKSNSDGDAVFDNINRTDPTKYQLSETGNNSLLSPARPAAAKSDIEKSIFSTRSMTYADYNLHATGWSNNKKSRSLNRKEKSFSTHIASATSDYFVSPPPSSVFSTLFSSESLKAGRQPEVPFHENYIGTSMKLVTLIKVIHDNGSSCPGSIVIRRKSVLLKRLSLQVTVNCSLKSESKICDNGLFKWVSSGQIPVPNTSRMAFVPDVLYSLATYVTPNTKDHAEQFFSAMSLTPPSKNYLTDLVKGFVTPYLVKDKERIVIARCEELRNLNEALITNMDVGYTGARKAQCATTLI